MERFLRQIVSKGGVFVVKSEVFRQKVDARPNWEDCWDPLPIMYVTCPIPLYRTVGDGGQVVKVQGRERR